MSIHAELTREQKALEESFVRLSIKIDAFEAYPHPHAIRIAVVADEMAKLFNLAKEDRLSLRLAALTHDLGELTMQRDYIKRNGPLTYEERLDLTRHPIIGEQEAVRAGADRGTQLLIRWHHEWWNGTGYPDALRSEQIPFSARILRVIDSYVSLTGQRPFRPALTDNEARKHLIEFAGLEFDPNIVRAFLSLDLRTVDRSHTATHQSSSNAVNNKSFENIDDLISEINKM
jgi:HD-GYP domain-containing protein (c-di-GMP phosphodiesterase class II)